MLEKTPSSLAFVKNSPTVCAGLLCVAPLQQCRQLVKSDFATGFTRNAVKTIGNPWKDIVRPILYVFLPLSLILSLLFVSQGVIENFDDYQEIETLEGSIKTLPMGPVASFEAIKQIGTNGGGFFNSNSAHPFENPNEITNFLSLFFMLLILNHYQCIQR